MVRLLSTDCMLNGSNPPSAKLSLGMKRVVGSCDFIARLDEVSSHQEEGIGHCRTSKMPLNS